MNNRAEEIMICAGAIDKYGRAHQLMKLAEECAELAHAVMRYLETREMDVPGDAERTHIYEEAADLEITLTELRIMYPHNTIEERKADKLQRLAGKIGGWRDARLQDVAERMRVKARAEDAGEDEDASPLEGCEIREG